MKFGKVCAASLTIYILFEIVLSVSITSENYLEYANVYSNHVLSAAVLIGFIHIFVQSAIHRYLDVYVHISDDSRLITNVETSNYIHLKLDVILSNKIGYYMFMNYLITEFMCQNLLFLTEG